ncbi:MAG TPA: methyltransferase domain-containing protein [Candidatus Acidoferrales bacterium]|nr:methyltransferase domain-containing protein [Candidatus Acidoferrales bacterium]
MASEGRETTNERESFTTRDEWEKFGLTNHIGGIKTTRRLIEWCGIAPGQHVIDVGCGTGYGACLLAKEYQVDVAAVDITPAVLEEAKKRVAREKVSNKVKVIEGDAHKLPFPSDTFDVAIAESVLIFCEKAKVASEVFRVLKPGGVFGDNEATYVKRPPAQLRPFTSKFIGADIEILQEHEWRGIYEGAGFEVIQSTVSPFRSTDYITELFDELRVDGVRKRLSAVLKAFSDPTWRRTFLMDRETRQAIRQVLSYMGNGLYASRKPR